MRQNPRLGEVDQTEFDSARSWAKLQWHRREDPTDPQVKRFVGGNQKPSFFDPKARVHKKTGATDMAKELYEDLKDTRRPPRVEDPFDKLVRPSDVPEHMFESAKNWAKAEWRHTQDPL